MTDDSYSYTGSYTGEYSYTYSYSDGTGSYTGSAAEKSLHPELAGAPRANVIQDKKAPSPSKPGGAKNADSADSYSYSYSYSDAPSSHAKAAPAMGNREKSVKWQTNANEGDDRSYSYSYTDDDNEGSYSYSYSDSQTGTATPPMLRTPKVVVVGAGQQSTKPAAKRANRIAAATPPAVTSTAVAVTNAASAETYSYSYSDDDDNTYSYSYNSYSDSYYYSDDSYYYSNSSSYASDSYYYSDGSYYYDGSSYYSDDSYYYSDTYSYTGDSSYYYSYSSSTASGERRGRRGKPVAHMASGSSDYYYSSSYSGEYTDNSDSYYYGSSYTGEDSYYDYSYSSYSYSSYAYSATGESSPSTTLYAYGSFAEFLLSECAGAGKRELVVLRAPAKDVPHPPEAPKCCFVVFKSTEDVVWRFLQRLMALQRLYEAWREVVGSRAAAAGTAEVEREETSTPFTPTKEGCFSERSMRIAFRVLRLNHLERQEALRNAPVPLPMEAMEDIFNTCVVARAKERVAQAFLAHDTYRSGEMSLTQLSALLQRLGLGTSPIIEGHRISIGLSTEGTLEMIVKVGRVVQSNASATSASAKPQQPIQWEVTPVYVLRIIRQSAADKESASVHWRNKTIYMGRHLVLRGVATKALFQRLKTYIEAAAYLCVLAKVFSIEDTERGTPLVQYPQFIRGVLLANPPADILGDAAAPPRKLLYIENLFRVVFHPLEMLQGYMDGSPVPRYNRHWAVESTLYSTNDTEEKRRRNVVPGIGLDMHVLPTPSVRPTDEVRLSFAVEKVRVPARPPRYARCFCLVSVVTPAKVFLPAIEVPVRHIVPSAAKDGYYTWRFHDKKHKRQEVVLQFAGSAVDSIYVECCYETYDACPPESPEEAAANAEVAATSRATSNTTTVWCAGYAVFAVYGAMTAVLPIKAGSLLHGQPRDSTFVSDAPAWTAAAMRLTTESGCCTCNLDRYSQYRNATENAHQIKVKVLTPKTTIPGAYRMPVRYIAYRRHVPMISQLRTAVELMGRETSHVRQTFRQQAVRYIFSVVSDPELLDQLCALWKYRVRHWTKAERNNEGHKHRTLLACVAALYGLKNSCAGSKEVFAKSLVKGKPLYMIIDSAAPMVPVRV
ncbi:conserved hypothetical protein [Leishmania braziliensis MHOM/BR/75/M2904]|uniref:EF-hand domain-containing protein n=2 Tax=Leishmania braziliensis TaxID=5660 RepID=A4HC70_LEIBR|nr:conserved hypothetical protein [Leishmania braziliensis MHOM/BR/75/M2904]CAJ2472736.1 unnamed protein product [Leishmania braziliensis]CAJ2473249.1 unnamed protein product [Leishmania braziliensis]CAM45061.1 conserved hypothetical protein [Leishmania braziliensis MHOM/BR/75/M2904]SYZ65840.1 hypothetical_protein [Leishmania braziliensis MHOM/BR/75/M2904]